MEGQAEIRQEVEETREEFLKMLNVLHFYANNGVKSNGEGDVKHLRKLVDYVNELFESYKECSEKIKPMMTGIGGNKKTLIEIL